MVRNKGVDIRMDQLTQFENFIQRAIYTLHDEFHLALRIQLLQEW